MDEKPKIRKIETPEELEKAREACDHYYVVDVKALTPEGLKGMAFRISTTGELEEELLQKMIMARAEHAGWGEAGGIMMVKTIDFGNEEALSQLCFDAIEGQHYSDEENTSFVKLMQEKGIFGEVHDTRAMAQAAKATKH